MVNRDYILNRLKSRSTTIDEFNFDKLQAPPLMSLFTPNDIGDLYSISHSIKYSANPQLKYKLINQIMNRRGFQKLTSGTNRICYRFVEDNSFVAKVAYDDIARGDNPAEFQNQFVLKPFVAKTFEVSPCGTIALSERVNAITNREEFITVADDVYTLISEFLIGEYVLADIGSKFFMNYGIRNGFGVVLLDYPFMYKVDLKKLYCSAPDPLSPSGLCDGEIDYDEGFNFLHCTKCGARYKAQELALEIESIGNIIVKDKGGLKMKIHVSGGNHKPTTVDINNDTKKSVNVQITKKPLRTGKKETRNPNKAVNGVNENKKVITPVKPKDVQHPEAKKDVISERETELLKENNKLQSDLDNLTFEFEAVKQELELLKERNKNMMNNQEDDEESDAQDAIEFHTDSAVEAAYSTISDYFNKIVQLSGLLDDTDCEDLIKDFDIYRDQCRRSIDENTNMTEKDHYDAAVKALKEFQTHFDEVEDLELFSGILSNTNLVNIVKLYDREVYLYKGEDGNLTALVKLGYLDEEDIMHPINKLTDRAKLKSDNKENNITYFYTDNDYKVQVEDKLSAQIDENTNLKDALSKEQDKYNNILEEYLALKDNTSEKDEIESDDRKTADELLDPDSDKEYGSAPIMLHGVSKDIKDMYPNMKSRRVILLEDVNGEFVTGSDNGIIAIDKLDNQKYSEISVVSSAWLSNVESILNEDDEDESSDEEVSVGVNGVK